MEKAILDHLLDEVVHKFASDFIQVIAVLQKFFFIVDRDPVNIFHDQYMRRCIFSIQDRRFYKGNALVLFGKFRNVGSFCQEVHLLLCHCPQFTQDHVQVNGTFDADRRHQPHCLVHQTNVPCHRLVDSLALYFDDNFLTCFECCPVNLCNGCGTEWSLLDLFEFCLPGTSHRLFQNLDHLRKRHRRYIGAQFHQLIAVTLGKDI